jgi:hypothetical protein
MHFGARASRAPHRGDRMPPILVIDQHEPTRAARAALRRGGAAGCDAVIADTCMIDIGSTARVHALTRATPAVLLVTCSRTGVMAPIHDAPNFQAMADRLAEP